MGIPIEKTFVVRAPAGAVWDFLTDPGRVARCLPGAAITEKVDDQTYGGTITVKVGPVVASYRGKVRFEKLDAASREAEISASGQETKGKGGADMRMKSRVSEHGPGEAEVSVVSDVNVVGVLAQFGRGMIQDVSDQMFQKFTDGMRRELEASAAAAPAAPQAAATSAAPAAGSPAASTPGGSPVAAAPAAAPSGPAVAAGATGTAVSAAGSGVSAAGSDMPPAAAATPAASGSAAGSGSPTPKASAVASPGPPAAAAGAPAAPAAPAPAPSPAVPVRTFAPAAASEEVLDVGALGAAAARRAAGRTLHRPGFWLALAVLAILIYVFFFRH
jgi:carbon monoxide dehydrogenase subunit G